MCVYPRLIPNPKYLPNKKNKGNPAEPKDTRIKIVPIGCGKCIECREQKARDWKIRLYEEFKYCNFNNLNKYFITLTFDEYRLNKYIEETTDLETGEIDENEAATKAVREFLERWRKHNKKSLRHWLITELGHDNTERIHLHGIIITEKTLTKQELEKRWRNGWVHIGDYCNLITVGYITKYVTKIDNDHPNFYGKILCSSGIGDYYIKSGNGPRFNAYIGKMTKEYYRSKEGYKMNMPIYYRNHIYTEEQREQLWINKLDEGKTYLLGIEYDLTTKEGIQQYQKGLKAAQETNKRNGYQSIKWDWEIYNKSVEYLNNERIKKIIQNVKKC